MSRGYRGMSRGYRGMSRGYRGMSRGYRNTFTSLLNYVTNDKKWVWYGGVASGPGIIWQNVGNYVKSLRPLLRWLTHT